jgi:hypothetical protein
MILRRPTIILFFTSLLPCIRVLAEPQATVSNTVAIVDFEWAGGRAGAKDWAFGLADVLAVEMRQRGVVLFERQQVRIILGERHFGQPVIDPAAETELSLIPKECGFTLVDDKSPQKADVEITGDAFSAYGMRRGNLISCKARVELKVQKRTGEVLAVDRQTSVAVDIAEQTAAKTALQEAAAELAQRLAPEISK